MREFTADLSLLDEHGNVAQVFSNMEIVWVRTGERVPSNRTSDNAVYQSTGWATTKPMHWGPPGQRIIITHVLVEVGGHELITVDMGTRVIMHEKDTLNVCPSVLITCNDGEADVTAKLIDKLLACYTAPVEEEVVLETVQSLREIERQLGEAS